MKKLLLKLLAFVIVVIAVNNFIFSFIHLPFQWGFYYDKERCLEANAGSFNTLLMGSSHVGRQIDPVIFDSINKSANHNTRTINLGMDGITIAEVYYQFKHVINQNHLHAKYILVDLCDVDTFTYENLHTTRKKYYYNGGAYYNSVASLLQSSYTSTRKLFGSVYHTLNFMECSLKFNELDNVVKFKKAEQDADYNCSNLYDPFVIRDNDTSTVSFNGTRVLNPHGQFLKHTYFLPQYKNMAAGLLKLKPDQTGLVDKAYLNMVNDMIAIGKLHSVQVIFVLAPKLTEAHYRNVLPIYYSLKPENKINLADPGMYPEFYDLKYAYDLGHLDKVGSAIYTCKLTQQFLKIAGGK